MNLKNKLNVITNIAIIITFIFTLVLIVDEIYNIGMFAINYTYNYNYGTFHSNFNNIQTIEYETNRYNVYNKTDFLYKDIFNKSYFNFLMKVAITFITVLFAIAYGIYYYEKFITDMPLQCNFENADTFLKKALKCICDKCHEMIPNCTSNYFISFILIIVIPISYLIKSLSNNIDFTPTTESTLFGLIYIIMFAFLLLKYTYELYSNTPSDKIKIIISYLTATIVLILSGHIYKHIYKKYTDNPLLNSEKNITVFNDIYKQAPPIKPSYPVKPSILSEFSYDPKNTSAEYKRRKEIVDNYYSAVKSYDADLLYYNQRYENYKKSITNDLGEKINIVNVFLNITGLNNYIHLIVIGFIIFFAVFYYYFYKDEMIYMCMIYMTSILIIMTIMNGVQYYNTYLNKYIIYEPTAHYKSDIATVNTKLNLLLDPSNGEGFYNYLTNTKDVSEDIDTDKYTINEKHITSIIRNLISDEIINNIDTNDDKNQLKMISNKLTTLIIADNNDIPNEKYEIYVKQSATSSTFNDDFINIITKIQRINFYRYPITSLYLKYNNNIKFQITPNYLKLHNAYIYCKSYQLLKLLEKLEQLNYRFIRKLKEKYYTTIYDIQNNYFTNTINDDTLTNINNNINAIKYAPTEKEISFNNLSQQFDYFIKTDFNTITPANYNGSTSENITLLKIAVTNDKMVYDTTNKIFTTTSPINIINKIAVAPIPENSLFKNEFLYDAINGFKLPHKITDNMNNEYYITSTALRASSIIIKITNNVSNEITVKQKYEQSNQMNVSYKYNTTNKFFIHTDIADTTPIIIKEYPFLLNYSNNDIDNDKNILINIVLRTFEFNLTRIISSFENTSLCGVFNSSDCPNSAIKSADRFAPANYASLFTLFTSSTNTILSYKSTGHYLNAITTTPPNYMPFIILLYNIYNYDENRIINIIEYCVYSYYYADNTKIDDYSDDNLIANLNSIKYKINKSNDSHMITKYLKNVYIIKFIVKLYSIFIKTIKYRLEQPSFDDGLCMPNNATKYQIETKLFEVITKYFDISGINVTAKSGDILTQSKKDIINQISKNCMYFFNICIYLLNSNMDKTTDLSLAGIMNSIISNYKFYNPDDLDEINLENLKKEVSINCNYYNKYNQVDKKQLSIMKMNADIVSFNFPVLAVIFLIFLGEPLFIKS